MAVRCLARIDAGIVAELLHAETDPAQLFHPTLQFADVTDQLNVGLNWRYDGSDFTPPPPSLPTVPSAPAMSDLKAQMDLLNKQFALLAENH